MAHLTNEEYLPLCLVTESRLNPGVTLSPGAQQAIFGGMDIMMQQGEVIDLFKKSIWYRNDASGGLTKEILEKIQQRMNDGLNLQQNLLDGPPVELTPQQTRLLHAIMGVHTEVGELGQTTIDCFCGNKALDRTNMIEELGDIMWYMSLLLDCLGTTWGEVMTTNILKLQTRHGEKFSRDGALLRNLDKEREVLENGSRSSS